MQETQTLWPSQTGSVSEVLLQEATNSLVQLLLVITLFLVAPVTCTSYKSVFSVNDYCGVKPITAGVFLLRQSDIILNNYQISRSEGENEGFPYLWDLIPSILLSSFYDLNHVFLSVCMFVRVSDRYIHVHTSYTRTINIYTYICHIHMVLTQKESQKILLDSNLYFD